MNLLKGLLIVIYYILDKEEGFKQNVIYKYIPRTLKEDEESPIFVSEIFKSMFTQPSVWIDSINSDKDRAKDKIDKFYISQM